jgi:glycosyltransferase involved in cell wall biosynthesis/SAM-dependent methyltransferase
MHGLTIVCGRDMARARLLARQFLRYSAGDRFSILISDPSDNTSGLPKGARAILPADIGIDEEELGVLGALHGPQALPYALLPRLLASMDEPAVYLGPTTAVLGPLVELEEALSDSDVVVVPTLLTPVSDDADARPTYGQILDRIGVVDRSVLGWRPGELGRALLEQWPALIADADPEVKGRPNVFQRWLDSVPASLPGVHVLRDPGYGAAYWNLETRPIAQDGDGVTAAGSPLRLLNLSGFDPDRPDLIAREQTRVRLSASPILARLVAEHARDLRDAGWRNDVSPPPWSSLPDGTELSFQMRVLYRDGHAEGALELSPFTPAGQDAFFAWLNEPGKRGAAAGITRFLYAVWENDPQLHGAYPQLDGPDGLEFAAWTWVFGREGIPDRLLPPKPDTIRQAEENEAASLRERPPWGVNVAGFFTAELGLGEAARLLIAGLDAVRVPALPLQGMLLPPSRQAAEFSSVPPTSSPYPITILCMNGDTVPVFAREVGGDFFHDRHTIALWWWELGELPDDWAAAFEYLDEIWVATEHIYRGVAPSSPVPVNKVPLPVTLPPIVPYSRAELGMPEGFVFLFVYDYHSTSARKNPLGAVEAFKRAFPEGSGASLVLKSINHENLPEHHEAVAVAAAEHADIHLISRYVSADEKNAMLASCDCYVSLHRSEGFGLTPAEAMYLGKPVIATAYGGVVDFMTDRNSYLVGHTMSQVGPDAHPYPPEAWWADPDLDEAARLMRHVFENPEEAADVGRHAANDIRGTNSPEAAGRAMKRRLAAIYDQQRDVGPPVRDQDGLAERLEQLGAAIATGEPPLGAGTMAPVRKVARKAVNRLTAAQTAHNRDVDYHVRQMLDRLQLEHHLGLAEQRSMRAELMADLRRLRAELKEAQTHARALEQRQLMFGQHLAEHATSPYMAPEHALLVEQRAGVGRVLAFGSSLPQVAERDWYRAFEDAFRGSELRVRELQDRYVDLVAGHAPVLDVGCGRGEFLDLLREHRIEGLGVDLDPGMVAAARAKGHEVAEADLNEFLADREPGSLGAVIASEVIEHLPYAELLHFLELAHSRLAPGGIAILETVNPHSLTAAKGFWLDPTHQHPLFPEVVLVLCRIMGFADGYVFHPTGVGDFDVDRLSQAAYAALVRKGEAKAAEPSR